MFYYISFLRPPPIQAAANGPVLITPQIANDLRTEAFESSQDIFYSWAPPPKNLPLATSGSHLQTTRPTKLTTYRGPSAYKEITVPLPPRVGEGQQWRLILSPSARSTLLNPNYAIDMNESTIGNMPFPVISMPILFSGKGLKGNTKKQDKIERIYRFLEPSTPKASGHPVNEEAADRIEQGRELKITEQTSFDLDKKIWDSGIGLSSWLTEFQNLPQNQRGQSQETLWQAIFSSEHRNIVELGAGTGIVSLMISSLRAQFNISGKPGDKIITTDLESAIPLLNHNITSNLTLYPHNAPKAEVLDWDDDVLPESVSSIEGIDVIVMSDVTYNTSSFPHLLKVVSNLIRREKPPVILLGYKERDVAERDLWNMLETIGLRLEKIGERGGAVNPTVEVWFGYSVRSSATS